MTRKEKLALIIKNKGFCSGIRCTAKGDACPFFVETGSGVSCATHIEHDKLQGEKALRIRVTDIRYTAAVELYLNEFGKDELVWELL